MQRMAGELSVQEPPIPGFSSVSIGSNLHDDIFDACLVAYSRNGVCCHVPSDGSWLSLTDRHVTSRVPLDIGCGCRYVVFSHDSMYIVLVDDNDRVWVHDIASQQTRGVSLPECFLSEFDTVIACAASSCTESNVFLIATTRHIFRFQVSRDVILASIGGFESDLVECMPFQGSAGQEYIIVQTQENCYFGQLEDEGKAFVPLYQDVEEGTFGTSTAMALCQSGLVAFAMQGKEVHVWDILDMIREYDSGGIIEGISPRILVGFDADVIGMSWSLGQDRCLVTFELDNNYAMVWNIDHLAKENGDVESIGTENSMVCCTESKSHVVDACFHPNSDMLALLSGDGQLSFYGVHPFWSGGIRAPIFAIEIPDCTFKRSALLWKSDGTIFICTSHHVLHWDVGSILGLDLEEEDVEKGSSAENIAGKEEYLAHQRKDEETPVKVSLSKVKTKIPSPFSGNAVEVPTPVHSAQPGNLEHWSSPIANTPQSYVSSGTLGSYPAVMVPSSPWGGGNCFPPSPHTMVRGSSPVSSPPPANYVVGSVNNPSSPVYATMPSLFPSDGSMTPSPRMQQVYSTPTRCHPSYHPSTTTVYIGNIPLGVEEDALRWICSQYGSVFDVQTIKDQGGTAQRGYAFVTFSEPHMAKACINHLNGQYLQGAFGVNRVRVAPSKRKSFGEQQREQQHVS